MLKLQNYQDVITELQHKALPEFLAAACLLQYVPFFGGVFVDGIKNFVTVLTLLDFSLVFLSSNLLKGVMEGCDWVFCCRLAYASSSSLCNLWGKKFKRTVEL